jgi:succinate dehydrogenase / fumarate reductase flavoprotein subunit
MNNNGTQSDHFHRRLGKIMWDKVGMARNAGDLMRRSEIAALREEFYKNVRVPGTDKGFNQELEKATRVADS